MPLAAGSATGKVVLVDRGTCNFSEKIANVAAGGGKIGVIGLVTPGDPFDGTLGICPADLCHAIPGYMVSQADSTAMKGASARVTFDPANGIPLVGHMVGSSSRGPSNLLNLIKPEIGAPGASVSAVAGSGTGTAAFGGTSGAAPMVTGSAALLTGAYASRSPIEIKAVLINTADTNIMNRPAVFGGTIAPITRIGGGEVRVDQAFHSPIAAWVDADQSATLGYGFIDVTASTSRTKSVHVRNYTGDARTYAISSTFRFANDQANGAVSVTAPASVTVPAHGDASFDVTIAIDPSKLRAWSLDSGINGANAAALTSLEYDGYVWLNDPSTTADDANPAHLPWQVLPRRAAHVTASADHAAPLQTVTLTNTGRGASLEFYSLVATSPKEPETATPGDNISDADFKSVGVESYFAPAGPGSCSNTADEFIYAIDVSTWERQTHSIRSDPVRVRSRPQPGRDGRLCQAPTTVTTPVSRACRRPEPDVRAEPCDRCGDRVLRHRSPDEQREHRAVRLLGTVGLTLGDLGKPFDADGFAVDYYTSGTVRDTVEFTGVFGGERYVGVASGQAYFSSIGTGASVPFFVFDFGAAGASEDETGIVIRVFDGDAATENFTVTVDHP